MICEQTIQAPTGESTKVEELLWERYWTSGGRNDTHAKLVEHYLPLVVRIVERLSVYVRIRAERDELLSIGVLGLHDTISRYARDRDVSFSTFAYKRIHGAIMDELRKLDHLTRRQRRSYRSICQIAKELADRLSRAPTTREIAEEAGIPESSVTRYMAMAQEAVRLDAETEGGGTFQDILPDDSFPSPLEAADREFGMEALRGAIKQLRPREQQLLYLRHHEDMRVKEIAEVLEVSEGRISQIYKEVIEKLRKLMKVSVEDASALRRP